MNCQICGSDAKVLLTYTDSRLAHIKNEPRCESCGENVLTNEENSVEEVEHLEEIDGEEFVDSYQTKINRLWETTGVNTQT